MVDPRIHHPDPTKCAWYVIHTKPRQEARALENLANQGLECFLPTLTVDRLRDGRKTTVTEPLFPRYLFVRLEAGTSNWAAIRSTRGVARLVEFGGVSAQVSSDLIEALKNTDSQHKPLFVAGDRVRVVEGPFTGVQSDLVRLYETEEGELRAMMLLELLSRPQQISLPVTVLRRVA